MLKTLLPHLDCFNVSGLLSGIMELNGTLLVSQVTDKVNLKKKKTTQQQHPCPEIITHILMIINRAC